MKEHIDSPCANVKQNRWPRLPILTAEMESSSAESEGSCGYDPDSESDNEDDESSRVLKSKYLDSPELLREAAHLVRPPLSSSPPTLKPRMRAQSVGNLEHLLGNDVNGTPKVTASTMLDGQQCEDLYDFVPDVSSVDKIGPHNHLQVTSILNDGSSGKGDKDKQLTGMNKPDAIKMESGSFARPENKSSSFLIRKTSTPGEDKRPKPRWEGVSSIHSSEASGSLLVPGQQREILTGEEQNWSSQEMLPGTPQNLIKSSQEILPGTPQNHILLTMSRMKTSANRVARTLQSNDSKTLVDIQDRNETIAYDLRDNDCNKSEDNLIIIEDDESTISNYTTATAKAQESIDLVEFPAGQSGAVTVAVRDYATLDSGTFVNDIMIDFYIKFLEHTVLPQAYQSSVLIFSTMFYKRLMQSPKKKTKKLAFYETDATITSAEKRHFRVAGWTKNVDLFQKKMIIVPICQSSHWFLLIVVNPAESSDKNLGAPRIIVLDSLGGEQISAVSNLRSYLAWEWKKRKCDGGDHQDGEIKFSSKEMPAIYPDKPEQENGVDCGVFLLHYVEKIFQDVAQFLSPSQLELSAWFTMQEVGQKRARIAQLVRQLAKKQNGEKIIQFPEIKLEAPMRLLSTQKPLVTNNSNYRNSSQIKPDDSKESSAISNRFYSNQKMASNVKQARDKPQKLVTPNPAEITMSSVHFSSPRVRRQPTLSSGVEEESESHKRLSFDQILKQTEEKLELNVKNTSQSNLEDMESKNDCSGNKLKLMEVLKQSLLLISPERSKIESSHEESGGTSELFRSPSNKSKEVRPRDKINKPWDAGLRDKINKPWDAGLRDNINKPWDAVLRDKINNPSSGPSKRKLSSSGEVSTTETSADLFTPGRGTFHVVSSPKPNDIKTETTKKFKLASRVRCTRFNDDKTKAEETFERIMNSDSSGEGSDIFS